MYLNWLQTQIVQQIGDHLQNRIIGGSYNSDCYASVIGVSLSICFVNCLLQYHVVSVMVAK